MFCLIDADYHDSYETLIVNSIVMCSKSKEELQNWKELLEKKFKYQHFEIIEL